MPARAAAMPARPPPDDSSTMARVDPPTSPPPAHPAAQLPSSATLDEARRTAATCTACPLYAHATQTVFGEGAGRAALMLIGEQPGDREDRIGGAGCGLGSSACSARRRPSRCSEARFG